MPAKSNLRPALRRTALMIGAAILVTGPVVQTAHAQDAETRIRKLEQEVNALQRKVFPGGSGRYFEPEITAPQQARPLPDATGGPVTDLLSRMDAVEAALARLTSQVEVNTNALSLMNARVDQLERAARSAPMASETSEGQTGIDAREVVVPEGPARSDRSATDSMLSAMSGEEPAPAAPAEIERPETGDPADDAYVYGFRLWNAGRYADARAQLQKMVETYPAHRRASWARNLIGRAWLDEGKPRPAAEILLQNYLENRDGERAPDSLVYLAIATLQLGNKAKACEALEEFRLVYPNEADGRLAALSGETARKAGCN